VVSIVFFGLCIDDHGSFVRDLYIQTNQT